MSLNPDSKSSGSSTQNCEQALHVLYDFTQAGKGTWRIQDDVVMGGRSDSKLHMTNDGHAHFTGNVSLENNGGFCSMHQTVEKDPYKIDKKATAFVLKLKADGKKYNFRVRTPNGRHSYALTFPTVSSNSWESVVIPFDKMEATYRGESVDVPHYKGEDVVEMQLLIGNKKEQSFELFLESIATQ